MKKIKKYYENVVFIIDEKDSELFERAKEQSADIYFMIENLEFFRVDFVVLADWWKEKENGIYQKFKERFKNKD